MSFMDKITFKIRDAREPDSLDLVEQVMKEEERQERESGRFASPDYLGAANLVLVITVVLCFLIRWQMR
jgi:hypothetical protein